MARTSSNVSRARSVFVGGTGGSEASQMAAHRLSINPNDPEVAMSPSLPLSSAVQRCRRQMIPEPATEH
jgi:hypothetical protein